jgi:tetratricopeptide (TPR) repeat protein
VQFYRGEFAEAEVAQRRAVAANPNSPEFLAQLGWRHAFASDWEEGIALVRQAVQQSMAERGWYYFFVAIDDYRRGDYRSALVNLRRLGGSFFFLQPAIEAMCVAQLGDKGKARKALDRALAADPTVAKDPRGAFRLHHFPEDLIDRFMDGLRKAGLEDPGA